VRVTIEKIILKQITLDPKFFLLGIYIRKENYNKGERAFIDLSLLHAKKCIALHWKNTYSPSTTQWLQQMLSGVPLERMTYILKDKTEVFESVWRPFISFVKNMDPLDE